MSVSAQFFDADGGLDLTRDEFQFINLEDERALAKAWIDDGDESARNRLVTSHARLAIGIANGYRRYQISFDDLLQEANIGLIKAAEKFDPEKGVRFSTYAQWWIKASIQQYVMNNWSLVKIGTTAEQKQLFFKFRATRAKILAATPDVIGLELDKAIAEELDLPVDKVSETIGRLEARDASLNTPVIGSEGDNQGNEIIDFLEDENIEPTEQACERRSWMNLATEAFVAAMGELTPREQRIIKERKLRDRPTTLEILSGEFDVSRERIRQIEVEAMKKITRSMHVYAPGLVR